MPNHVTSVIKVTGCTEQRRQEVVLDMLDKSGYFNFHRIAPIPAILFDDKVSRLEKLRQTDCTSAGEWVRDNWGVRGNCYDNALCYRPLPFKRWHRLARRTFFRLAKERAYVKRINKKRYKQYIAEHGAQQVVEFDTSWSMPYALFLALSRKYPDVTFNVHYADEDTGWNCGIVHFRAGQPIALLIAPNGSKQSDAQHRRWRKFAFNITHPNSDPRDYGYDENWDYVEE